MKYDVTDVMNMINKAAEMTEMEIDTYKKAYDKIIKERDTTIETLRAALEISRFALSEVAQTDTGTGDYLEDLANAALQKIKEYTND